MERQTEITIEPKHFGGIHPAPDLSTVKVRIDGAPAKVVEAKPKMIKMKAPPEDEGDGPWSIVVTKDDDKTFLRVLDLKYDPETKTFSVKPQHA
jgi:hypothetical protein